MILILLIPVCVFAYMLIRDSKQSKEELLEEQRALEARFEEERKQRLKELDSLLKYEKMRAEERKYDAELQECFAKYEYTPEGIRKVSNEEREDRHRALMEKLRAQQEKRDSTPEEE